MTITKKATAKLSRVSVGLTLHDGPGAHAVLLAIDSSGLDITLFLSIEDFDILRETLADFDVHGALQLEEDATEGPIPLRCGTCGQAYGTEDFRVGDSCVGDAQECRGNLVETPEEGLVLGGRLHTEPQLDDAHVDPVGGYIETATMLKSQTHDCWIESIQDFQKCPRYVLHYRALDGQMNMRTGDSWCYSRHLAIHRLHELEKSGEAMVKS